MEHAAGAACSPPRSGPPRPAPGPLSAPVSDPPPRRPSAGLQGARRGSRSHFVALPAPDPAPLRLVPPSLPFPACATPLPLPRPAPARPLVRCLSPFTLFVSEGAVMGGRCGGGAGRAPRAPGPQRGRPAPPAPPPATQDLPGGPKCRWTKGARGASSSRGAGEGPPTATPSPGHASLSLRCGISSVAPGRSANAEGNKRVSIFDNGGLIGSRSSLQSLDCGYEAPSRTTAADLRRYPSVRCQARGWVTGVSCFLRVSFCPSQRRSQRVRISSPSEWPMPGTRLSLAAGPRLEHVTHHAVEITRTRMRAPVGFPGSLRLCRGRSREWGISVIGPRSRA